MNPGTLRSFARVALVLAFAMSIGIASAIVSPSKMFATNTTVVSSISHSGTTTTIEIDGWHQYSGEDGVDLMANADTGGYVDAQASSNYLYWESSNYGSEGGGTSPFTGKVFMVWYSNGGVWTPALLQNIVHLDPKVGNSYGTLDPYQRNWIFAGYVGTLASQQNRGCAYTATHIHDSRGTYWGNSARAIRGWYGDVVQPWDTVILGRD